ELSWECGAEGVAVWSRLAEWNSLITHGRWPAAEVPRNLMTEALDREAAGEMVWDAVSGPRFLAAPIRSSQMSSSVIVAALRDSGRDELWLAALASRLLGESI